ncbi:hypothetical protein BBta_1114 [Bradyrhizobium sp. BTAi1]|nr:hypothetical protein BBta_1114 [Bradyrhizobium sp. BTAi1]
MIAESDAGALARCGPLLAGAPGGLRLILPDFDNAVLRLIGSLAHDCVLAEHSLLPEDARPTMSTGARPSGYRGAIVLTVRGCRNNRWRYPCRTSLPPLQSPSIRSIP